MLAAFAALDQSVAASAPPTSLEKRDTETQQSKLVGILFPVFGGDSTDNVLTFVFKEQVRLELNAMDGDRALGFSQSYMINAPLSSPSHESAVRLARRSGFQGVVWGSVADYEYGSDFDGIAVFPSFSWAGGYEDFRSIRGRTDRQIEVWKIEYNGKIISADPPSDFVPFPPYLVPRRLIDKVAAGGICARSQTTGECTPVNKLNPNKMLKVEMSSGSVVYQDYDGVTKYHAVLPLELFADQSAVAYVAMFFNYARGHWSNTERLALEVEKSTSSTSQMVHDALLLRSAALFRSGKDGSAPLAKAKADYPDSPALSHYEIMVGLMRLKSGQISKAQFQQIVDRVEGEIGDVWLAANGLTTE